MKPAPKLKPLTLLLLLTLLCSVRSQDAAPAPAVEVQKMQPAKVDLLKTVKDRSVYLISEGEVNVGGDVIKRVEFGKTTVVVTYFNKTKEFASLKSVYRLINAYGFEVAIFGDQGLFNGVPAGEMKKEEKTFNTGNAARPFEFTQIALPEDWEKPVYLVIEDARPGGVQTAKPPQPAPPRAQMIPEPENLRK